MIDCCSEILCANKIAQIVYKFLCADTIYRQNKTKQKTPRESFDSNTKSELFGWSFQGKDEPLKVFGEDSYNVNKTC